jgi:hypothetical protein
MDFTDDQLARIQRAADEGKAIYESKKKSGLVIERKDRLRKCEERGISVIRGGKSPE